MLRSNERNLDRIAAACSTGELVSWCGPFGGLALASGSRIRPLVAPVKGTSQFRISGFGSPGFDEPRAQSRKANPTPQ